MLNKKQRIPSKDISIIFQKGEDKVSKFFVIKKLEKKGQNRFAVVVSKKNLKNAAQRNLLRRRIYEIIRTSFRGEKKSFDHLIICRNPSTKLDFIALKQELLKIIHGKDQPNS